MKQHSRAHWKREEEIKLKQFGHLGMPKLVKMFPNKSYKAISMKLNKLRKGQHIKPLKSTIIYIPISYIDDLNHFNNTHQCKCG